MLLYISALFIFNQLTFVISDGEPEAVVQVLGLFPKAAREGAIGWESLDVVGHVGPGHCQAVGDCLLVPCVNT